MLTIRQATLQDAEALARLHLAQLGQPAPSSDAFAAYLERYRIFLDRSLSEGNWAVWSAEEDGTSLLALYVVMLRKPPHLTGAEARIGFLAQLDAAQGALEERVTLPFFRNLVSWARTHGLGMLTVCPSLPPLETFARLGFQRSDATRVIELQ